tara:strand:+ start:1447 stop:4059 length:2613 start_codon:yes stop_codon:yes gene_type:complete
MATLQEIAQQFEDALSTETGTTVTPGIIAPVGITTSAGKRKLSWPEVVKKLQDNLGLTESEVLPDIPGGFASPSFFRAGIASGLLPSGATTFSQPPFSTFSGRINQARTADSTTTETPVSPEQPQSFAQPIRPVSDDFSYTSADAADLTGAPSPTALPGELSLLGGIGAVASQIASAYSDVLSGKKDAYISLTGVDPQLMEEYYNRGEFGNLDTEKGRATADTILDMYSRGHRNLTMDGQVADTLTGKPLSYSDEYAWWGESHMSEPSPFEKVLKRFGIDVNFSTPTYQAGYDEETGNYTDKFGNTSLMGSWNDFDKLIADNPQKAAATARSRGRGGVMGLDPKLYDRAINAEAEADAAATENLSRGGQDYVGEGYDPDDDVGYDIDAPSDAAGAEQGSFGGEGGGYDPSFDAASGGEIRMQEGGNVPEMPQQGAPADMANLGIINAPAAEPQQGGQKSVQDDIPREADEGDYILPYETVLLTGLNQLNRYAREAIKLAMENDIALTGTDIDPTDDVPIKVSNYEFHIPKVLVPFFGGGKKYLDKIRDEGLALRKRLEEEKQPSMQEQQPMPEEQPQQMAQAAPPPQAPMMQTGGFVMNPDEQKQLTTESMLEADTTQAQESSYNQIQALERTRRQAQQPAMVDPTGKIVQQGFAAPQGYQDGSTVEKVDYSKYEENMAALKRIQDPDIAKALGILGESKSPVKNEKTAEEGKQQVLGLAWLLKNRELANKEEYGGSDPKNVLVRAFSAFKFDHDEPHRKNFERMVSTKTDDPDFNYILKIVKDVNAGKIADPTNGSVFVLNQGAYKKEQGGKRELPSHLQRSTGNIPLHSAGNLTFYGIPKPSAKPTRNVTDAEIFENMKKSGGFIKAA